MVRTQRLQAKLRERHRREREATLLAETRALGTDPDQLLPEEHAASIWASVVEGLTGPSVGTWAVTDELDVFAAVKDGIERLGEPIVAMYPGSVDDPVVGVAVAPSPSAGAIIDLTTPAFDVVLANPKGHRWLYLERTYSPDFHEWEFELRTGFMRR